MRRCRACGGASTVVNTREAGNAVNRRRKCKRCRNEWRTIEVEEAEIRQVYVESLARAIRRAALDAKSLGDNVKGLLSEFERRFPSEAVPYPASLVVPPLLRADGG